MENLYEFFSKSNFDENGNDTDTVNTADENFSTTESFPYNDPINETEILEDIKKLKKTINLPE